MKKTKCPECNTEMYEHGGEYICPICYYSPPAQQIVRQGRVYAEDPDQAAMKVRDKYPELEGGLFLSRALGSAGNWYEYQIEKRSDFGELEVE